jgi:hypothetical protein
MARIWASKAWDRDSKLEDFQIRAGENGLVLINLKTRRAQLIYDEDSELRDLQELFPDRMFFPEQDATGDLPRMSFTLDNQAARERMVRAHNETHTVVRVADGKIGRRHDGTSFSTDARIPSKVLSNLTLPRIER